MNDGLITTLRLFIMAFGFFCAATGALQIGVPLKMVQMVRGILEKIYARAFALVPLVVGCLMAAAAMNFRYPYLFWFVAFVTWITGLVLLLVPASLKDGVESTFFSGSKTKLVILHSCIGLIRVVLGIFMIVAAMSG